jgi:hypothetical protein
MIATDVAEVKERLLLFFASDRVKSSVLKKLNSSEVALISEQKSAVRKSVKVRFLPRHPINLDFIGIFLFK